MILAYFRYFLAAVAIVVFSILITIVCLLRPTHPGNTYYAARLLGNIVCFIMGMKLEIENPEHLLSEEGGVIISNHQSNFDAFYIGVMCPKRTVSLGKKAILYFPFFGLMYWLTGNILIDRKNKRKAWNVMDKAVQSIKKYRTRVWIMPEGTRSKGRGTLPFKRGAFVAAIKAQCTIVPVCIASFDKHVDVRRLKAGTIKVKILPPIKTEGMTNEDLSPLRDRVYEQVKETVDQIDASYT